MHTIFSGFPKSIETVGTKIFVVWQHRNEIPFSQIYDVIDTMNLYRKLLESKQRELDKQKQRIAQFEAI